MMVIPTPEAMRAWSFEKRAAAKTIGLVPTMGALHEGHGSLVRASVAQNDETVVSIFVNPTQFAPHEDLDKYPRTFDADLRFVEDIGASAVYAPTAKTMYPGGYRTYVEVAHLTEHLCGKSRPHFFRGVATVVAKLFTAVMPHRAYFGQKDAQQYAVIKRMARDLDLGIDVIEMPIVREPDGLAMSSRNAYLNPEDRQRALCLSRALRKAESLLEAGERNAADILRTVRDEMAGVEIDYVEMMDAADIQPIGEVRGTVLLAVAAKVGNTRLIDNMKFVCDAPQ